jgi:hypothetical protein
LASYDADADGGAEKHMKPSACTACTAVTAVETEDEMAMEVEEVEEAKEDEVDPWARWRMDEPLLIIYPDRLFNQSKNSKAGEAIKKAAKAAEAPKETKTSNAPKAAVTSFMFYVKSVRGGT